MYLLYPGLTSLENGECPTGCLRSVSWGVKSCYVLFGLFVSNYLTGVPVNYVDKLSHRHLFEALDNTANYRTCG